MAEKFEKVSFEEFLRASLTNGWNFTKEELKKAYDNIKLPMRSTDGSAGYDFYSPFGFTLFHCDPVTVPTGIRVVLEKNHFLLLAPRSGNGFKTGVHLMNTIGIIDSDYYNPGKCEGQIMVKLMNSDNNGNPVTYQCGSGIMQGIVKEYISLNEYDKERWAADGVQERVGGFGSTGI